MCALYHNCFICFFFFFFFATRRQIAAYICIPLININFQNHNAGNGYWASTVPRVVLRASWIQHIDCARNNSLFLFLDEETEVQSFAQSQQQRSRHFNKSPFYSKDMFFPLYNTAPHTKTQIYEISPWCI
jgi:hypothetical protein